MNTKDLFVHNLDKVHTTELGIERIKRNLLLDTTDVVEWSKAKIASCDALITRIGKNYYIKVENYVFTVNASSYTIITAKIDKNAVS